MGISQNNSRRTLIGAAAAASVALGTAGLRSGANAQTSSPDSSPIVQNDPSLRDHTNSSHVALESGKLPVAPSSQTLKEGGVSSSPDSGKMNWGLLSTVLGAAAMGYWYLQLRARKTAISLTTGTLWSVNDALLCGTALATGQGWGAALPAIFSAGGALCVYEMWKAGGRKLTFDKWDKGAMVGCCLGWAALLSVKLVPSAGSAASTSLAVASAAIATATYIVATYPMVRAMLKKPEPGEIRPVQGSRFQQWISPVMPYIVGTAALGCSWLAVSKGVEWYVHLQPGLLFFNNVALIACQSVWSFRRLGKQSDAP